MTIRFTPAGDAVAYSAVISSTGRVRTRFRRSPSSLTSMISFGIRTRASSCSRLIPKATPRLGFGSPSTAVTLCPRRARTRDRVAEIVVLPEPPLPATAIFIVLLSHLLHLHDLAGHRFAAPAPALLTFSNTLQEPLVLPDDPQTGRRHPFGRGRDTAAELPFPALRAAARSLFFGQRCPLPVLQKALPEGPQILQSPLGLLQLPFQ